MPRHLSTLGSALVLSIALALGGCGESAGEESAEAPEAAPATEQARLEHTHGVGVDPASDTVYVATHYGLFRAGKGATKLRQVGTSTQDIMGFAVSGPGRFIGSGHPGEGQAAPSNLGLIASEDAGRTWRSVSLSGEADFHVLRSSGRRIYGFDGTRGRLMVSRDAGRSWDERTPPAAVIDLAIHPKDPDRIVASTEAGVFASPSAGAGWRPLTAEVGGLLVWPAPDRLLLADAEGNVLRSADQGRTFTRLSGTGGPTAAFATAGTDVYLAFADGTVKRSQDGGATWTDRARP